MKSITKNVASEVNGPGMIMSTESSGIRRCGGLSEVLVNLIEIRLWAFCDSAASTKDLFPQAPSQLAVDHDWLHCCGGRRKLSSDQSGLDRHLRDSVTAAKQSDEIDLAVI